MSEETNTDTSTDNTEQTTQTEATSQEAVETNVTEETQAAEATTETKTEVKTESVAEAKEEVKTDDSKTEEVKPIEYTEFTLPEGFVKDEAMQDAVLPLFQKNNISQENAQEMVDVFNDVLKVKSTEQVAAQEKALTAQVETWTKEKQADPEFKVKMALAEKGKERIIKEVPSAEKVFGDKLWGNMPEFYEIAQFVGTFLESEATALGGTTGNTGAPTTLAQALYGDSMKPK